LEVLAGLVDGNARGSGKDQDMKEVRHLNLLATGEQRQLREGVDGQIEDILTWKGILRHTHGDSPNERGYVFSFVIGIPLFFEDLFILGGIFNY